MALEYTKMYPLGKRSGLGSFETFYDIKKYIDYETAIKANDCVVIDFVSDENGIIYFSAFHTLNPSEIIYRKLNFQHFPCGLDILDDNIACEIADELLNSN